MVDEGRVESDGRLAREPWEEASMAHSGFVWNIPDDAGGVIDATSTRCGQQVAALGKGGEAKGYGYRRW